MSFKSSTGARNSLLDQLSSDLNLGFIRIFDDSVAEPSSPDDAEVGTNICIVSNNSTGTGLTFESAASGSLAKTTSETWSGLVINGGGTAAYYRFVSATDSGNSSTTDVRVQGSVGTINADLLLADVGLIVSETQALNYYTIGLPAS